MEICFFKVNSPLLEAVVLSLISVNDMYGYKITQEMHSIADLSESTLYPVLRRLKKDGSLESYSMKESGRSRCYYKITAKGETQLSLYKKEWEAYTYAIDLLFKKSDMTSSIKYP